MKSNFPHDSPWKQPTFRNANTVFLAKWRLRNKRRNSTLMTHPYKDLGSASDWLKQISLAARPIRSTTQIWVVTHHQYPISALVPQTLPRGKTSRVVAKYGLFLQARDKLGCQHLDNRVMLLHHRDSLLARWQVQLLIFLLADKTNNNDFLRKPFLKVKRKLLRS